MRFSKARERNAGIFRLFLSVLLTAWSERIYNENGKRSLFVFQMIDLCHYL